MGDARDTAKKKKADEKKSAKPREGRRAGRGGARGQSQGRGEIHEEVTVPSHRADLPDPDWRCPRESRDAGSGSFRNPGGTGAPANARSRVSRTAVDAAADLGGRSLTWAASRLRVESATVKGCDGTSYCSSESWHARANADRARVPSARALPDPGHPQEHPPIQLQAVDQQVLEQVPVGTGITDGIGGERALAQAISSASSKVSARAIQPGGARVEHLVCSRGHFLVGNRRRIQAGDRPR